LAAKQAEAELWDLLPAAARVNGHDGGSMISLRGRSKHGVAAFGLVLWCAATASCRSELSAESRANRTSEPASIEALALLGAKPGDVVGVNGRNLRPGMTLVVDGIEVALNVQNSTSASFIMPQGIGIGLVSVGLSADDPAALSIVSDSADDELPIMLVVPELVCSDVKFRNAKGEVKLGRRDCAATASGGAMPAKCKSDGETGCVATSAFKATKTASLRPTDIRKGVTIAGVAGMLVGAPADCTSDGAIGCVANAAYRAADMSAVTAGTIKRGATVAGVLGAFPSAAYPLPRYGDAGTSTGVIGDGGITTPLTAFATQLKSDAPFEFWDASGVRRTGAGDADLVAANVLAGVDLENVAVAGTAPVYAPCAADAAIGCITTSRYKAADTDSSVISAWDIRQGKSVGGIAGQLTFYKSRSDLTRFNRTSGTGALAGIDIYDSIDDYNASGALPTQAPTAWPAWNATHWQRDAGSDDGAGGGTAGDGICNGGEDCVYADRIAALLWAQSDQVDRMWEDAITFCDGLNAAAFGGYASGWRVPTQVELMHAYADGIWSQMSAAKLNLGGGFWSTTTNSTDPTTAWIAFINDGRFSNSPKSQNNKTICLRSN
jgi:hypothetical protein